MHNSTKSKYSAALLASKAQTRTEDANGEEHKAAITLRSPLQRFSFALWGDWFPNTFSVRADRLGDVLGWAREAERLSGPAAPCSLSPRPQGREVTPQHQPRYLPPAALRGNPPGSLAFLCASFQTLGVTGVLLTQPAEKVAPLRLFGAVPKSSGLSSVPSGARQILLSSGMKVFAKHAQRRVGAWNMCVLGKQQEQVCSQVQFALLLCIVRQPHGYRKKI